jgi:hypothetical protein
MATTPYYYVGNKDPRDGTAKFRIASGFVALGTIGQFTPAEFNSLNNQYFLEVPGSAGVSVVSGPPTVQTITVYNYPHDSFVLTFNGQSATFASGATPTAVQAGLQALSGIGAGGCLVTGPHGGPYVITFAGSKAAAIQNMILVSGTDALPAADLTGFSFVHD